MFGDTQPVLQLVTGLGATGAELARSGVDKIAFTGSAATARKVLAAAADTLTPVLAECGGKDALLVAADADLDAAADAVAWGAMSNAGQTCVGVERVYVAEAVYQPFMEKLSEQLSKLRPGEDDGASYGPMTLPGQVDVVERHVADAVARGGRAAAGGLDSVRAPYVDPVVLVDVPADSAAMREETFGPVVTVTPVPSLADAVRLANASPYALGSAVFTKRRRAGLQAARALRAGMTSVNSVVSFAAVPALPFGGSRESGFGRIHGPDGLREFSRAKSITRQRMRPVIRTTTFRRDRATWTASCGWSRCCTGGCTSRGGAGGGSRRGRTRRGRSRRRAPGRRASAGSAGASGARPAIRSAARSAIAITGAFVLPRGSAGMTDASTTRSPSTPRTRSIGSTTLVVPLAACPDRRPSRRCPPGGRSSRATRGCSRAARGRCARRRPGASSSAQIFDSGAAVP